MPSHAARNVVAAVLAIGFSVAPAMAIPVAPKGVYKLDPDHTQIVFGIKHMGLSNFLGRFSKVTGTVNFDQMAPEQSVLNVEVDMRTIDTHVPELDSSLPNSVFQADKFPVATFVSTAIKKTGDNTGTVTGNLTIAGVTKPETLTVTFNGGRGSGDAMQPYRIGFDATGSIKRSDFGLTGMIWSGFVADDVQLTIEAEAIRK
jgi:polyisoprenoid-binding protein YceI